MFVYLWLGSENGLGFKHKVINSSAKTENVIIIFNKTDNKNVPMVIVSRVPFTTITLLWLQRSNGPLVHFPSTLRIYLLFRICEKDITHHVKTHYSYIHYILQVTLSSTVGSITGFHQNIPVVVLASFPL